MSELIYDKNYLFRVWGLSMLFGTLFLNVIIVHHSTNNIINTVAIFFVVLITSMVISIPTLTCCHLVYNFLNDKHFSIRSIKFAIILISCVGSFITFYFMLGRFSLLSKDSFMPLSYCLGILLSIKVCKLKTPSFVKDSHF